jgi:hypothetical protein
LIAGQLAQAVLRGNLHPHHQLTVRGRKYVAEDYSYPARLVRKHIKGMPAFNTVRGGEYVFLPA